MALQEYVANKILSGVDVNIQDQHTPPIDSLFLRKLTPFTLSADTVASGKPAASLVYNINVTSGHGLVAGSELLLLDVVSERDFYAVVISSTATAAVLDRPIDHLFPAATTLGRIVSSNMNVNGSVTPVEFSLRAGTIPRDITRIIFTFTGTTIMDDGLFGSITALTRGLVFRIVNSYQRTIFCFKTNGDVKLMAYDGDYGTGISGPNGTDSFSSRITFGGQTKHGVVLRISTGDVLQIVVQDDLRAMSSCRVSAQGHLTDEESL